jgi:cysteine desulfurase
MKKASEQSRRIYFDNAATTKVEPRVLEAMMPYFKEKFGNASSIYSWGEEARRAVEKARERVAKFLEASPEEIFFTSGATESINWSHKGVVESSKLKVKSEKLPHIITSSIEHKAVLETCKHLEKMGMAEVSYLPVDEGGRVKVDDVEKAIRSETVLVSIMYVNNEVGTVEPIEDIGRLIAKVRKERERRGKKWPIFFHTDATQAIQYFDCNVEKLGADLLSLTGHKFYAPKGIGVLYIKRGTLMLRQQDGGGQELGMRAGTENVAYIAGLGKAIELITNSRQLKIKKIENLRMKLEDGVLKEITGIKLLGQSKGKAPHIAAFVVLGVEGESLVLALSDEGIAASTGSACTSSSLSASHVLLAMGVGEEEAHGSLRISLGKDNTEEEVDYFLEVFSKVVARLRKMAPKY